MLRRFVNGQMYLSQRFDRLLPKQYRIDGNSDYEKSLVPKYLRENIMIYDVGGGKNPYLGLDEKMKLNATVIGLDIDNEELLKAPLHAYDRVVCSDISRFRGTGDGDLVLCQAVLEHVKDVAAAFEAISSILKAGGLAIIFVPSRNAAFARLNILLPQNLKRFILHTIYPSTKRNQGFPSFYDKCTPSDFRKMAEANDLAPVEERFYYFSSYFSFLFPAYVVWRIWVLLFALFWREQAAETFSIVLRKGRSA